MGTLDAELSVPLSLSLSGKGSAVLLSRGGKYGSCQGPYDAACAACAWTQREGLMTRTCRLPEDSDSQTHGSADKCKRLSPEWNLDWSSPVVFLFFFLLSGKVCCVK